MTSLGPIILIDDEETLRMAASQWLKLSDFDVMEFSEAKPALNVITPDFAGVIVTDVRMPRMSGLELMDAALAIDKDIPVVLITGHGDVTMAVEAIQKGAYDFIEKPFQPEALVDTIKRASEKRKLIIENRALKQKLNNPQDLASRIIGNSDAIQQLRRDIMDLAGTDASILIQGETGAGKEVVAQALHDFSTRKDNHFVAINCGAVPENIFESELFGHEAGAFTGAQGARVGKMQHASSGTLFLDEISSMPLNLQVKVLRALQERKIERLGANDPVPVDIRLISASNMDLMTACEKGEFRDDLYYRLNVAEIRVPPLRERGGDIVLLFEYFMQAAAKTYNRDVEPLSVDVSDALLTHKWPGNVRELKNAAERYVLSSASPTQRIASILRQPQTGEGNHSLADRMKAFEKQIIESALRKYNGNIKDVLEDLDLPRRTLNQKMQDLGIKREDFL
ncbi:sigma-54 dependent transcriptional regulator [Terasakiella sp. A23]|uniref:sigma-54-dependent transcriptional regulator n=1 Tax=Terasakiella sp. FCG-A23 TaxID=3080561 RepID=UPI0029556D89|nr:sigma-54 dependent transcriptional regulator [Terasakiella sp. A23]MDV7338620.1 sigma-54 dependent transcriptional regulator [Terasakiella sp. A23]